MSSLSYTRLSGVWLKIFKNSQGWGALAKRVLFNLISFPVRMTLKSDILFSGLFFLSLYKGLAGINSSERQSKNLRILFDRNH